MKMRQGGKTRCSPAKERNTSYECSLYVCTSDTQVLKVGESYLIVRIKFNFGLELFVKLLFRLCVYVWSSLLNEDWVCNEFE